MSRLIRTLSTALVLTIAVAAPAAADSIAYIDKGDVWVAGPDGSRKVQVTKTGGYFNVSQADDGTMITLVAGEKLRRIGRDGTVLAEFLTPISDGAPQAGPVNKFHGPFNPQISPDGTKVAYEFFNDSYDTAPGCNETTVPPCAAYKQSQGVLVSDTTGFTPFEKYGLMTGWIWPQWIGNDMLLRSDPSLSPNDDAVFTPLGGANENWFYDDQQGLVVGNIELSRDRSTFVGVAGFSDEKLRVYRTTMSPFGAPDWDHTPFTNKENVRVAQQCFELPGTKFESTSLAPSGTGLVYGTKDGLYVSAIGADCALAPTLLAPGASSPDWGPADVPAPTTVADDFQPHNNHTQNNGPAQKKPTLKLAKKRTGVTATHHHRRARPGDPHRHPQGPQDQEERDDRLLRQGRRHLQAARQEGHGHRQGDVQAAEREREAATRLTISAPVTDPHRLRKRSPSVSRYAVASSGPSLMNV